MKLPQGPKQIIRELEDAGYEAFAVGGCVRDSLLGREPSDWDLCTSALPRQIKAVFEGKLRQRDTGIAHGTVTLLAEDGPVEVTTYRKDGAYTDHRRPDRVILGVPLEEDLARRDFTINAMAMAPGGPLQDPFGGQKDLKAKLIRCVGEPRQRFSEDALRILRALRFAAQLDFQIDPDTLKAARECAPLLNNIARERVFQELDRMLQGPGAGRVLAQCGDILAQVIPQIGRAVGFDLKSPMHDRDLWQHTASAVGQAAPRRTVRWALLLHDLAKPDCFVLDGKGVGHAPEHGQLGSHMSEEILHGLRAPNRLIGPVRLLIRYHDYPTVVKEQSVRRWLARLGPDLLEDLIEVKRADLLAHARRSEVTRRMKQLKEFHQLMAVVEQSHPCLRLEDMAVNGRDLIRAGICRPGPVTGRMLRRLLSEVIEGRTENNRQQLLALAHRLGSDAEQKDKQENQ